jgi:hypothetical protein
MQPKPNRTRHNDPEGFRALVLDFAADLYQAHGYHATSIKDVMQASLPGPCRRFERSPSKRPSIGERP